MSQYREGRVSVANGSAVVTGTGTAWAGQIIPGQVFSLYRSGISYTVAEVVGNTELRLSDTYKGATAADQPYTVTRDFTPYYNLPYPDYGDIDTAALWKELAIKVEQAIVAQDTGLTVIESRAVATPPASPAERVNYIVPAGATGAWAGKAPLIAVWDNDVWKFIQPQEGWRVHVRDESYVDYIFDEGDWRPGPQVGEAVLAAAGFRDEARAWAEKTDGPVSAGAHSARHHALTAAAADQSAQAAAATAAAEAAGAAGSAAAALIERQAAETARTGAETARDAAQAARTATEAARDTAAVSATAAGTARDAAQAAGTAAGAARDAAAAARTEAEAARSGAETARAGAETAQAAAEAVSPIVLGYRDETASFRGEVIAARDVASNARTAAETAKADAQAAAADAAAEAGTAASAAATAGTRAAQATESAAQASTAATAAVLAQTGAETARTAAAEAKTLAIVAQGAAETARDTAAATAASIATRVGEADAARAAAEAAKANAANSAAAAAVSATDALLAKSDAVNARDTTVAYRDAAQTSRDKARGWAETAQGTEVEPGLYSAKHHALEAKDWAEQAAAVVGGNNFAIIGDGTAQRVTAQNPGEMLNLVGTAGIQAVYNQATRSVTFKGVAAGIPLVPAGTLSAETVQDALYELDAEKLAATHQGTGGAAHALADDTAAGFLSPQHHALLAGATAADAPETLVRRDAAGRFAGTAARTEVLDTPRTLSLGGVGATPVAFDGSADVEIAVTAVPAGLLTGTVPLANLPAGALERLVEVADDAARFALTTAEVQPGDTVQVGAGGPMYRVVDTAALGSEAGYREYTAGMASSVPWSGVSEVPATLADLAGRSIGYTAATDIPAKSDVAGAIASAVAAFSPNSLTSGDSSFTVTDTGSLETSYAALTLDNKGLLKIGTQYALGAETTQMTWGSSTANHNTLTLTNPKGPIRIYGARSDTSATGNATGVLVIGGFGASGSNKNGGGAILSGGTGDGTGTGGSPGVYGGDGGASGNGGNAVVQGGRAGFNSTTLSYSTSSTGNGGSVMVTAGRSGLAGGSGGGIKLAGGQGYVLGGSVEINGGTATDGVGGGIFLTAASSTGTNKGGDVHVSAGNTSGSGNGGNVALHAGISQEGGYPGAFYWTYGGDYSALMYRENEDLVTFVGLTSSTTTVGRSLKFVAGNASGTDKNGGSVTVQAGNATGSGVPGSATLKSGAGGAVKIESGDSSFSIADAGANTTANLTIDGKNFLKLGSTVALSPAITGDLAADNAGNQHMLNLYNPMAGIRLVGANSAASATGGAGVALLQGGHAASGSNLSGGSAQITGGAGDGSGGGGSASVNGGISGATGNGGIVNVRGGNGGSTSGDGGYTNITAGSATNGAGGDLYLSAGSGTTMHGRMWFRLGTTNALAFYGNLDRTHYTIQGQTPGATANGPSLSIVGASGGSTSGSGGSVSLIGGSASDGDGGVVQILANNAAGTNRNGGNVTISSGTATGSGTPGTITLNPAAGGAVVVNGPLRFADGTSMTSAAGGSGLVNTAVLTGVNAVSAGQRVLYDTRSAAGTATLPASPNDGDQIAFLDVHGSFATHALTVARNGRTIAGAASDLTLNLGGTSVTLMYLAAAGGWVVLHMYARSA